MDTVSIAVWDVPLPVTAGERFPIKVGGKSSTGAVLTGGAVEVCGSDGRVVATGRLGGEPWPGTQALYWVALEIPAPAPDALAEFTVRLAGAASRFVVAAVRKPEHRLAVTVVEQGSNAPLRDVEIRLGPFHARTDAAGRAELAVGKGAYQLQVWRWAYDAPPTPIEISGDASVEIAMTHVPEEHPDARWVR
jgi:hypothetical protein